jgi:HEAT repeat protein
MRRNLRRNLAIVFVIALTLIVAASVAVVTKHTAADAYDARAMQHELTRIGAWMKAHAPAVEQELWPPASRAQIAALAKSRGLAVPEEIYSLYAWHDGASTGTSLFGEYRFLPLAEAFAYGDAIHKAYPAEPYRLALFRSNVSSAAYTADCPPDAQWTTPVQLLYNSPSAQTDTLKDFLSALAQSFEAGAFEGPEMKQAIFERSLLAVNEEHKRALKQILQGSPDRVPVADEMAGYDALLATENPQAERFILLAAHRWSVDEDYSFTTMNLLARLDTPAAWDTLQKLMRNFNPSVRKRAYAMLAFYWPADGRQLDTATANNAIQDLTTGAFDNLDQRLVLRALRRSPDSWVPAVVAALSNPEKDTRTAAAETLGILADQRATAPLVAQAAKESDGDVRAACYHALADLGNAKGEQELLAALEKSDPLTLDHAAHNGSPAAKRLAQQILESRNASPRDLTTADLFRF